MLFPAGHPGHWPGHPGVVAEHPEASENNPPVLSELTQERQELTLVAESRAPLKSGFITEERCCFLRGRCFVVGVHFLALRFSENSSAWSSNNYIG